MKVLTVYSLSFAYAHSFKKPNVLLVLVVRISSNLWSGFIVNAVRVVANKVVPVGLAFA